MKFPVFILPCLLGLSCCILTGCDEVRTTLEKRDKDSARLDELIAENTNLENKLLALKQGAPPNIATAQNAFFQAEKAAKDLEYYTQQLDTAVKNYEESAALLKAMESEMVALRQIPRP
ncbi:hypothetical protein EI77_03254 [Prosthecobacter fusiformis]|uniref:Uncharacterized protein n=1 Tax=Prosthecobacter fusiformis TaxID=48464 RepID=A0A4R7RUM3_9BACT|nr:hypothetical protein [Prosthecobacter fusiformis]TDU68137.1 hypothetical protein EI77_03254 [Prosthecobacter fusiformis]